MPDSGTGIFVQVRLGSTRLPSKALLPLPGGCVIQHVMRALRAIPASTRALLTDAPSEAALRPLAAGDGFDLFVGPPDDVLARYCMAIRAYGVDRVVRATGDNPLTSARLGIDMIEAQDRADADLSHYLGIPWGTGVEVVRAEALLAAERDATRPDEREHITTHLYRHRQRFRIVEAPAPAPVSFPDGRVTVDTREDYEMVTLLFEELYRGVPIEAVELVDWLRRNASTRPTLRAGHGRGVADA